MSLLKADLHIHTYYSNRSQHLRWGKLLGKLIIDSKQSPKDVLEKAQKVGLNVISITDHDETEGCLEAMELAKDYPITVVPGIEITTGEGHVLAYGITSKIPHNLGIKKTLEEIKKSNGISVAAHPFSPQGIFYKKKNTKLASGFDAIEVSSYLKGSICLKSQAFAKEKKISVIAGSDSKYSDNIGSTYTEIYSTNHIESLLNAIKNGKTKPVIVNSSLPITNAIKLLVNNYLKI